VINLRWSALAAAAAFIISFALGISIRGQMLIVLLRALSFAVFFFFLGALVWTLINRYIPDLLISPSPRDSPLPEGLESGSQVNITLGDESIPQDAAYPPEDTADDSVGTIAEIVDGAYLSRKNGAPDPAAGPPETPVSAPAPVFVPAPAAASPRGMDQNGGSGYTQDRSVVSGASTPPISASPRGFSGVSGLGDVSGGVESLPDLDALAGIFLPPDGTGGEEAVSPSRPSGAGESRLKKDKGKGVGEDFNPKELASAVQTILKRD
jgi:hypothetical protein